MSTQDWREFITDAIRYWERGRILYNVVLVLVVAAVVLLRSQDFAQRISLDMLLQLFMLAVLANVAYCAAYPVDLVAQLSGFRTTWVRRRWVLWVVGTLFACVWAQFVTRGSVGAT